MNSLNKQSRSKFKEKIENAKRALVEQKIVTDFNLEPKGSLFLPVFTETAHEIERTNIK